MKTTANTTAAVPEKETYAAAYARLAQIAEKLKAAGTASAVDDLVSSLKEARAMYAICKARLDAIRREVDAEVDAVAEVTTRT